MPEGKMMKTYKLEEIFQFAVEAEKQGERFYEHAAADAPDKEVKDLFVSLGKAEVKHAKKFMKFHDYYARKKASFKADEIFNSLLDTLMRGMLFPEQVEVKGTLQQADRDPVLSAVKIGMDVETHSILFYQELSSLVKEEETREALSKIIKEEHSHLIRLKGLRIELDPYYAAVKFGTWF
jgi:rubrerythrin